MNWLQTNRWLGRFLIVLGICALGALYFLFHAKGNLEQASAHFREIAQEQNRLARRDPFPNEANFRKLKAYIDNYGAALEKFGTELKDHILPAPPLAPNEFQTHLRQAMVASAEKARASKMKLPDNFALGFGEFTAVLPSNELAPLLGQELAQVEALMNILFEARADGVKSLVRVPFAIERAETIAPATATRPAPGSSAPIAKAIERNIVDLTFVAAPSVARKILNQIASSNRQLYVIRTLHVRNEKDTGPARGLAADATVATSAKPSANVALNFIVGNEHIETSARIEMLRANF
jgi:hypothetical protein